MRGSVGTRPGRVALSTATVGAGWCMQCYGRGCQQGRMPLLEYSDPLCTRLPCARSEAKAKAAAELAKQGDHKAAVELWAQAINGDPANPVL